MVFKKKLWTGNVLISITLFSMGCIFIPEATKTLIVVGFCVLVVLLAMAAVDGFVE